MDKRKNRTALYRNAGLALFCVFVFLLFGISTNRKPPSNAIVFVDNDSHMYIAPPCVTAQKDWKHYSRMTYGQAEKLNLKANPACNDHKVFEQKGRSAGGLILEKIGLLKPLPSRWSPNGSWNW
jgi:hypothetical protein